MDIPQTLDLLNNVLSLILLVVTGVAGLFIFFSDPLRKWRFFGYLPTVIVALIDPLRNKILTLKFDIKYYRHRFPPMLPQGGIYTNSVGEAVQEVLEKELQLERYQYDIKHVREIGELNIEKSASRMHKYQYGILGISPVIRGKGYIGCLCICDSRVVLKSVKKGIGVEQVTFVPLDEFKHDQNLQDDSFDGKRLLYNRLLLVVERYLKGKE